MESSNDFMAFSMLPSFRQHWSIRIEGSNFKCFNSLELCNSKYTNRSFIYNYNNRMRLALNCPFYLIFENYRYAAFKRHSWFEDKRWRSYKTKLQSFNYNSSLAKRGLGIVVEKFCHGSFTSNLE